MLWSHRRLRYDSAFKRDALARSESAQGPAARFTHDCRDRVLAFSKDHFDLHRDAPSAIYQSPYQMKLTKTPSLVKSEPEFDDSALELEANESESESDGDSELSCLFDRF